ncbi:hypothetical protein [Pseudooceanicola nitratireducens]|uniref:hypothetical protein n=1 Tax=Pseudooceanicola nitratireducens TaxID=517719 RepID=UPI0035142EA0
MNPLRLAPFLLCLAGAACVQDRETTTKFEFRGETYTVRVLLSGRPWNEEYDQIDHFVYYRGERVFCDGSGDDCAEKLAAVYEEIDKRWLAEQRAKAAAKAAREDSDGATPNGTGGGSGGGSGSGGSVSPGGGGSEA